ncbi:MULTISPECIES: hypothetical protein [Mesorhizobium]|uniref:hypothetical protein n=1 Tax=Mesorhizobium TaxID=68287 RepID=UPI001140FB5F|nr:MULTISPECIES: hypothetical protein [Mesorhizobium]
MDKGFATLCERAIKHPSELLLRRSGRAISDLLGTDLKANRETLDEAGSGKFVCDDYVGTACTPHMCGLQEAMVFVSAKEHRIYAALKPDQKKIEVWPPLHDWPERLGRTGSVGKKMDVAAGHTDRDLLTEHEFETNLK